MQIIESVATVTSGNELFGKNAKDYHRQLSQGVALSGETPDYFARSRVSATARLAERWSIPIGRVLDFGCGVGTAAKFLAQDFPKAVIYGSDIATSSLAAAQSAHTDDRFRWVEDLAGIAAESIDLVYCNGVFHHIVPEQRATVLERICELIRPGGGFALWENNPWNVGTRWVMRRIPFDRDAICLTPNETLQRLSTAGLEVRCIEHHFFFPRFLAWLRLLEPRLRRVPLGAQYVVFATRPN